MTWIRWLDDLGAEDVASVGGKNAALGELIRGLAPLGVRVPPGFALTADAFRAFVAEGGLEGPIADALSGLDPADVGDLAERSRRIREAMVGRSLPAEIEAALFDAYRELGDRMEVENLDVAVRSSATAEDLPEASFAGQHDSFLYVRGEAALVDAVKRCFASLYNARAIHYRRDMGFDDTQVALSVGVQAMVRADRASSGVIFTIDTETGFSNVLTVNAIYGLGENLVQGRVQPDEHYVHKPLLEAGFEPVVLTKIGTKELARVHDDATGATEDIAVPDEDRLRPALSRDDVLTLSRWGMAIERHFTERNRAPTPMDIEWAKDGLTGGLFVVQARPETVHRGVERPVLRTFTIADRPPPLVTGLAVGDAAASGVARPIREAADLPRLQPGEILVSETTDPDWEPVMKRAGAIVTRRGGRTSHAAIVARELGIPAVVGAEGALQAIAEGDPITVSCCEGDVGRVYPGKLAIELEEVALDELPSTSTRIMMNFARPEQAFQAAQIPCDGVGLARMEFIFAGWVGIHPLALTRLDSLPAELQDEIRARTAGYEDPRRYFVDRLSQGIGTIAAAFWPRPVILRFSDFKSNEYAHLLGGERFEPAEENPMIGWRGASRYHHPDFEEGFRLELQAIQRVREVFGLRNLKLMVPFCRTPEEGRQVLEVCQKEGLVRGRDGLEIWVMAEIPSNVLEAEAFAEIFDGFSIGSNDLTQLCLGVDRDSERVAPLFDERRPAVKRACKMLIEAAHAKGVPVGICGQAPSDHPDFARFLVECGIDSISLSPDAVIRTRLVVAEAEAQLRSSTTPWVAPEMPGS